VTAKDHAAIAHQYAYNIVKGKIAVCKWVRRACQRHLDDLEIGKFTFDADKANRACRFIELLNHTKGEWSKRGEQIRLEPWQSFLVASIFGWLKQDGSRRFRRVLVLVPRKNGKSALAAGIALYMLVADNEAGAEVYSGATTEKQAWEVFRPAQIMARKNPQLLEHFGLEINAKSLFVPETGSRFEPVIGNPGDGASPSCSIVDEYHEHKTDALLDTMETGMGARTQPLSFIITTAGDNLGGPCYALQIDAQRILEKHVENDGFFALIYGTDPEDDWTTEAALRKANPNYGISVGGDFLAAKQAEARETARKQGTFKTKHLNMWVGARDAYFNVQKWSECAKRDLRLEDFEGQPCFIGMDLASKVDIAALEILFPLDDGSFARFGRYYLPEARLEDGENDHYRGWAIDGWLTVTDGEIIDFKQIRDDILDFAVRFDVSEIAYDPHQATMLVTDLMEQGLRCIEVRPSVLNFSDPMKTLDGFIRAGKIRHAGDPVMSWMVSNVVASEDAKENVYPRKNRNEDKIDGVVALLMALNRTLSGAIEDAPPELSWA